MRGHPQISVRVAAHLKTHVKKIRAKLDADPVHGPKRARIRQAEQFRYNVYCLLDEPDSSTAAMAICVIVVSLILLSVFCVMAETVPSFERDDDWQMFFWVSECIIVVVFTVEYIVRFWAAQTTKCQFICRPLNVIDMLAILPFYITLIVLWAHGPMPGGPWESVMRLLRSLRLLRLCRLGKFSEDLQFMTEAIYRSQHFFVILTALLVGCTLGFSSLIWVFERGTWDEKKHCFVRDGEPFFSGCTPFESVPMSSWWAIVTLSTVGYGDAFPITTGGRVVGGFAMMSGILAVALPTAVLGVEFVKHFKERLEEKRLITMRRGLQTCSKEELVLFTKLVDLEQVYQKLNEHIKFLKYLRLAYHHNPSEAVFISEGMNLQQSQITAQIQNLKRFSQYAGLKSEEIV